MKFARGGHHGHVNRKIRDPLNVIPMIVRDQNMRFDARAILLSGELIAQGTKAGAAIENERSSVGCGQFEAGSISPVAPGVALERGRRAADAPKNQFGSLLGHGWANRTSPVSTPPRGNFNKTDAMVG